MCVVAIEHIIDAVRTDAVQIVLSDHHYWGGLRHTRELGAICAAVRPRVVDALELAPGHLPGRHDPRRRGDPEPRLRLRHPLSLEPGQTTSSSPGSLRFENGALIVPTAPGLGVEVDQQKLAKLHDTYVNSGRERRDDAGYMRTVHPDFDPALPRF